MKKRQSLREFDLQTRMLSYPCSYLIQTPAFDSLPQESNRAVGQRMKEILTSSTVPKGFSHLSDDDRAAIVAGLGETKPELIN